MIFVRDLIPGQGDGAPLKLYASPRFVYASLGQTSHEAYMGNTMTLTIQLNLVGPRAAWRAAA